MQKKKTIEFDSLFEKIIIWILSLRLTAPFQNDKAHLILHQILTFVRMTTRASKRACDYKGRSPTSQLTTSITRDRACLSDNSVPT